MNTDGFAPGAGAPPAHRLTSGDKDGKHWVPAETDVSIRSGWFWHENEEPKTVDELKRIYYTSVGRNSLLLLNVPPDRRGRISPNDSLRLMELRTELNRIFGNDLSKGAKINASDTRGGRLCHRFSAKNLLNGDYNSYWTTDDDILTPVITIEFKQPTTFNRVMLQEYIPLGQRVEEFAIDCMTDEGLWTELARCTTIGYKRIVLTQTTHTTAIRIRITKALACPVLNRIGVYYD